MSTSLLLGVIAHGQTIVEDFESLTLSTSIGAETGWSVVTGSATVSDVESADGSDQSILLPTSSPTGEAVRAVQGSEWGSDNVAWWDVWVLPMAHSGGSPFYTLAADGSLIEFRFNSPDGEITVSNGGTNLPLGWFFPVTSYASDNWIRLTLRQDFSAGIWDLYVNEDPIPIEANIGFTGTPTEPTEIRFYGDGSGPVYFDELALSTSSPIFTDIDNDGMDDAWEDLFDSMSTALNDRNVDSDQDTLTNMQEYMAGTSPDDYYNAVLPNLTKVMGDNQMQYYGEFLPLPLKVLIEDTNSTALENAPITFASGDGSPEINTSTTEIGLAATKNLLTDVNGHAQVYMKMPQVFGDVTVTATVTSESQQQQVEFNAHSPVTAIFSADGPYFYGDLPVDGITTDSDGDEIYRETGVRTSTSTELMPVDTSRVYRLSGYFRSQGATNSKIYLSLQMCDSEGNQIFGYRVTRTGSAGTVSSVSDSAITVVESALTGWRDNTYSGPHRLLGIYYDGNTNKLPDHVVVDYTNGAYSATSGNQILLTAPLPSGVVSNIIQNVTVVHNQINNTNNGHFAASLQTVGREWGQFQSSEISGEYMGGLSGFWYGTKFVKVITQLNTGQTQSEILDFDDIVFEEIVDVDDDGLPDWWEREAVYALDANDAYNGIADVLPTSDYDGDGLNLLAEFQQGKNPFAKDNSANIVYVDNLFGQSTFNGLSAHPRIPTTTSGPKRTLSDGIALASSGDAVVLNDCGSGYDEATLSLAGKDLVLKPVGNVILR